MIPLICGACSSQTHEDKVQWWVPEGGVGEHGELVSDGYTASVLPEKKSSVDSSTTI